jgi:putative FmdB family regulatory protein
MPIYEYACKSCQHTLDALQKISDDLLVNCPACGKPQLKRLISAPRFRLKGAGWYETDFKKDKQRNLVKTDGDAAPSGGKAESADSSAAGDKAAAKPADKTTDKATETKAATSKTTDSKSE